VGGGEIMIIKFNDDIYENWSILNIILKKKYTDIYTIFGKEIEIITPEEYTNEMIDKLTFKGFIQPNGINQCWFYTVSNALVYSNFVKNYYSCFNGKINNLDNLDTSTDTCPIPNKDLFDKVVQKAYLNKAAVVNVMPSNVGVRNNPLVIPGFFTNIFLEKILSSSGYEFLSITSDKISEINDVTKSIIIIKPKILNRGFLFGNNISLSKIPDIPGYNIDHVCLIASRGLGAHFLSGVKINDNYYVIEPITSIKIPYNWETNNNPELLITAIGIALPDYINCKIEFSHIMYVKNDYKICSKIAVAAGGVSSRVSRTVKSAKLSPVKTGRTYKGKDGVERVLYKKGVDFYVKKKSEKTGKFGYRKVKV
jgi:hypothetical protein